MELQKAKEQLTEVAKELAVQAKSYGFALSDAETANQLIQEAEQKHASKLKELGDLKKGVAVVRELEKIIKTLCSPEDDAPPAPAPGPAAPSSESAYPNPGN